MIDEKLDSVLRKLHRLKRQTVTGDCTDPADDNGDCLPDGVILPLDSVRGMTALDDKLRREPDTKRRLVSKYLTSDSFSFWLTFLISCPSFNMKIVPRD